MSLGGERLFTDRLRLGTRLSFGVGAIPETIKNISWDLFVLFYFTQVLGLSGSLAGLAIGIALVIDAVVDPLIGTLSDGLRGGRFGKRQKLMALSILPFGITFSLLFNPPASLSEFGLFVWLTFFAVVCRAAISMFTIPYYALHTELSRNPIERPLLASFRQIATATGRFGVPFLAFTFFFAATPDYPNGQLRQESYISFGNAIAITAMLLMAWCIIGTNRRSLDIEKNYHGELPPRAQVSLLLTIRQTIELIKSTVNARKVLLQGLLMFISLAIVSVYTLHLCTYYWKLTPEEIRNVSIALPPGTLLAAFLARYYVPVFEKKRILIIAIMGYVLFVTVPLLGPMLNLFPQPGHDLQVTLLILFKFLSGLLYGAYLVTTSTVGCDIADEIELNVGQPRQALFSSLSFFIMGASSALVNIIAGVFLDVIGLPAGADISAVTTDMSNNLALLAAGIITVCCSAAALITWTFDISREKQESINMRLKERYSAGKTEGDVALAE